MLQVIIYNNFTRYFYCTTKICSFSVSGISFSAICFLTALLFQQLYILVTHFIINLSKWKYFYSNQQRITCEQYFGVMCKHTRHSFCYILMVRTITWSFLIMRRLGSKIQLCTQKSFNDLAINIWHKWIPCCDRLTTPAMNEMLTWMHWCLIFSILSSLQLNNCQPIFLKDYKCFYNAQVCLKILVFICF